ncbi:MAG: hypothetical protein P0116_12305 [Candidatus Nitrosocosmicus sp.]|nr:hypothetical protein [Candidatus Nitrosocosmicus sp.]
MYWIDHLFSSSLVGDIQYNIKDVVKDDKSELYKKLSDLRKTLFVFKILHQKDEFKEIKLNIKNRNAELTKPLLRLFNGSECLEPIRKSLSVLINEKSKIKSNSTESKILEALNELISNTSKDFKEVYQFTDEEIFKAVRRTLDGSDNNWDDYMDSTIITPDGMDISKKKITQILKSKFNAVPDKICAYGVTKRVIRVNKSWLEKLGKQYEIIDEIRILDSKSDKIWDADRYCEPDTMTDMTLVESASPDLEKENECSMDKENGHANELIIKNISIDNSLTKMSEPAPVITGAGSDSTTVDYNNEIIDKTKQDDDKQLQELDKTNGLSASHNPNSKNILTSEIVTSEILENNGQAPSESVISVISVRNSKDKELKEFDNMEEEYTL